MRRVRLKHGRRHHKPAPGCHMDGTGLSVPALASFLMNHEPFTSTVEQSTNMAPPYPEPPALLTAFPSNLHRRSFAVEDCTHTLPPWLKLFVIAPSCCLASFASRTVSAI